MFKYTYILFIITITFYIPTSFPQYGGGTGTSGDPYLISTLDHLSALSGTTGDWNKHFKQTANIDASSTSGWNSGAGFSPIGNSSTKFSGSYNGQNYTISGLSINRSENNQAFFGYTNGATIQYLKLTGVSIAGNGTVGSLVGYCGGSSTVSNCFTSGSVSGYYGYVGGFIGEVNSSTVQNCSSTVSTTGGTSGSGAYTGGFIGRSEGGGSSISYCAHTDGNVNGRDYVGGFFGGNHYAAITQCFSSGSVGGTSQVGGFVGNNSYGIDNCYSRATANSSGGVAGGFVGTNQASTTIEKCFSTGAVSASSSVGGFCGANSGTINNSFWDKTTSSLETSSGGEGKTTSQMTTQSTFTNAGWSNTVWNMDTRNDGYPYLDWENPGGTPLPVELTSFTASVNDNNVILNWETATEVDNYGFEIERVKSEELKVKNFTIVGFVQGSGNSNSPKAYSFMDNDLENGTYLYRLKQINTDGSFDFSDDISALVSFIPDKFMLMQNYPNPFNSETIIKYQLPEDGFITIKLFNVLGNESGVIINEFKKAGPHTVIFRAGDLSSGVYYYRMSSGNISHTARMILIK